MTDDSLIDRASERQQLLDLTNQPGPTLALVYGRRRVGKTYLLTNTWPDEHTFYFVAAESNSAINRRELIQAVNRRFGLGLDPADYPSWRTVFRMLYELETPKPLVVILDEFQYLMGTRDGVPSQLNAVHDVHRDRRPFTLVLCGSAVRTMEHLNAGDSPLYGRFARKFGLEPFDYFDAAGFVPFMKHRERAITYGIFGGTPRYLSSIRPKRSLAENVAVEVLAPGGQVRIQVETLMDQERGLRNTEGYRAILRAIGAGRTLAQEIADFAELKNETPFRTMLGRLVDLGFVRGERNFAAKKTHPFRYYLADPALDFHATFVELFRPELARYDPLEVWKREIEGRLDGYMGRVFERIVAEAYHRHRQRLGLPMVDQWGRWEGTIVPGRGKGEPRSIEMDIVSRLTDGHMLTGAVKWGRLGIDVHAKHVRELGLLADAGHAWARDALTDRSPFLYVAGGGVPANFRARAEEDGHPVIVWTLEDLYYGAD
jgi:AAA+ ATPase superfamily predicted ATPase